MQYKIYIQSAHWNKYVWKIKDSLNVSMNVSYFSQCIASQLESNFLKSPAYYESTKHYCCLHVVHDAMQCAQSVQRFRGQSAGYDNGCFSAVNRVWHLYSDNCDLKYHGNSIEFKYGWNFINAHGGFISDWNKVFSRSCLMCSSRFFGWVLSRSITTRWLVPCCGIAHAKLTPKQMKISVSISNQQQYLKTQVSETHKRANW